MMFAEMSGLEIGALICSLIFGGVGMFVGVMGLFKKQDVKVEQPLNVQLLESFVGKTDFQNHAADNKREFDAIRTELREDRRNNEVHASQRSAGVYKRIEAVQTELSKKMDDMPSRIIADLRNAKGLLE
jgi:hypothetical protein